MPDSVPPSLCIEADAYLFDIDSTLLSALGGVQHRAFHTAVEETFAIKCSLDGIVLHGNTDTGILRAITRREGVEDATFDAKLGTIISAMSEAVEQNRKQMWCEVMQGAEELVQSLVGKQKLLGVASGNYEHIGWVKLEIARLRGYFAYGTYCDRWETRTEIFQAANDEARRRLGSSAKVCFIGDTPADILSAQAVGAAVIAVGTGIFPTTELAKHHPDICVENLLGLLPVG